VRDEDSHVDDDDVHNTDQSVTGCNDEQFAALLKSREAWFKNEWFYCGIVLSVSKNGVLVDDHATSLWGIECNYPVDRSIVLPNSYLTEVANELLPQAIEQAETETERIKLALA